MTILINTLLVLGICVLLPIVALFLIVIGQIILDTIFWAEWPSRNKSKEDRMR